MDSFSSQNNALPQQPRGQLPSRKRPPSLPVLLGATIVLLVVIMIGTIVTKHKSSQQLQNTAAVPTSAQSSTAGSTQTNAATVAPTHATEIVFAATNPPGTWKTYTSAAFHYAIKYPPDWKSQIMWGGGNVVLMSPDYDQSNPTSGGFAITITAASTNKKSVYAQFISEGKSSGSVNMPHKQMLLDGIQAIQYDTTKAPAAKTTILVDNGNVYHFSIPAYADQTTESKALTIYNQLLSSFTSIK